MPAAATLPSAPQRPLRPDDPDAQLPPNVPPGAAPLPPGTPVMSDEARLRWAVIFAAIVVAIAVLALAIGRPLVSLLSERATAPPPPTPAATP